MVDYSSVCRESLRMKLFLVLLLLNTASCQSIGTMREISLTNEQVVLAVEVDPIDSRNLFLWYARVDGSPNNVSTLGVLL